MPECVPDTKCAARSWLQLSSAPKNRVGGPAAVAQPQATPVAEGGAGGHGEEAPGLDDDLQARLDNLRKG